MRLFATAFMIGITGAGSVTPAHASTQGIGLSIIAAGHSSSMNDEPPASSAEGAAKAVEPIRFNFKGATYQQVIEFFSRVTGLPVIWQIAPPEGTLDYISPEGYDQAQALRVLNIILQSKGVMLRVSRDNLFLQKLDQMQREDLPTFVGQIPADITPDQIITVVRPLKVSLAKPLAERLATMVASYGSVTAMEQQNTLVITETAANAQRLLTMIEQLDTDDPEGAVEIFSIKNGKASEMMVPLKALLSQKVERFVINQQGQQVKIEEDQMPGLSFSADDRTNSIVAKGVQNKVDRLREAIELLDKPGAGQSRSMTTIALSRITPAEAVQNLTQLYQRIAEKDRPTVLGLDEAQKVMIIGSDQAMTEGSLLIGELENGPIGAGNEQQAMISVVPLDRAQPAGVIAAINNLLNKRQQAALKLIPGTDNKSIIVSGVSNDVDAVKSLIAVLDRQAGGDRQVRVLRIAAGEPNAIFEQAKGIFAVANPDVEVSNLKSQLTNPQTETPANSLAIDLDGEARVVTLIGPAEAIESFTSALKQIESSVIVDREARRFTLSHVMPSEVSAALQATASQILQPKDGSHFTAPTFSAVDQLNLLIVTATPEQMTAIEPLIRDLDAAGDPATRPSPKLLQLRFADAANLANVLTAQYNQRSAAERRSRPVFIGADPQTNALIVAAHDEILPDIEAMVEELNRIERVDSESRELQIYPLKVARAEDLARTIDEMFPQPPAPLDARGRPQPQLQKPRPVIVRAEAQTNSLIISALPGVLNLTQEMIAQLDIDPSEATGAAAKSVHVLTIDNADAVQIAANLAMLFSGPGQGAPQAQPTIRVDAASNSLMVRATESQMQIIRDVVEKIDKATIASSRQMRMIAVDPSKSSADDVARALERMLGRDDSSKIRVMTLEELIQQRNAVEQQDNSEGTSNAKEGSQ